MKTEPRPAYPLPQEALVGTVERVIFRNKETAYSVISMAIGNNKKMTITGCMPDVKEGVTIEVIGSWASNGKYGLQFVAQSVVHVVPVTKIGLQKYLASGLIPGIGPRLAERIVDMFGEGTPEVIEKTPDILTKVQGVSAKKVKAITEAWKEQKAISNIGVFLMRYGVSSTFIGKIYQAFGASAINKIQENPYVLASEIKGIGFKKADEIALLMGMDRESISRFQAAVKFVLNEAVKSGSCGILDAEIQQRSLALLESDNNGIFSMAQEWLIKDEAIIIEQINGAGYIFPRVAYHTETGIANRIRERLSNKPVMTQPLALSRASAAEKDIGVTLGSLQKEAVISALRHSFSIITGAPGTGKTTIIKAIISGFDAAGLDVLLCAPTGKAAKRMQESTQRDALTIHRLLGVRGDGFLHDSENPLEGDVIIVDEASMVDIYLFYALMKALPDKAALIIVGDIDQLPSVGPGNVLRDIIESGSAPVTRLTEIRRQAVGSRIISAAHEINAGKVPDLTSKGEDLIFVECDRDEIPARMCNIVMRLEKKIGMGAIQVLSPMREGSVGVEATNALIQREYNQNPSAFIKRFNTVFGVGDKVMQTKNDYDRDIFNGDTGVITDVKPDDNEITVNFDGRVVLLDKKAIDSLSLSYACTIHKYQGSESRAVVIPVTTQQMPMLKRNLIYTGITRGRDLVVLVGEKKALAIAAKTEDNSKRVTRLGFLLGKTTPSVDMRSGMLPAHSAQYRKSLQVA